ncbi:unnamed protein product [Mytilus edulis]|uniref:Uncharacterized protein n=1 Tax=Mytilus edulis TaxID=6550 RepID=A0A8S3SN32_MYTED|nr:unnamed protein product [Mytilus edulis]
MFQKFKTCTRSDKHISSATRLKGNYLQIDWNDVVFCTTNTIWTPINGKDVVRDSSKTFLNNESDIDQQHKLSAERHSSSVCINTLIKGFSISSKVGLTLNAPKTPDFNSTENVEISTAFSRESRKEHTKEEKKGWTVEDNIVVPKIHYYGF